MGSESFFTKSSEEVKDNQEFTDFYLAAHSFGGFICGNYTLKYT